MNVCSFVTCAHWVPHTDYTFPRAPKCHRRRCALASTYISRFPLWLVTIYSTSSQSSPMDRILLRCGPPKGPPPECHLCANVAFHRRRQNGVTAFTRRPFAELLLRYLEAVGKLGPATGRFLPLESPLATGIRGDSILGTNVVQHLGVRFPYIAERPPPKQDVCSL